MVLDITTFTVHGYLKKHFTGKIIRLQWPHVVLQAKTECISNEIIMLLVWKESHLKM